jgi:type II secretion system protein N
VKERLLRAARWASYPVFYLFCLAIFGYLTFPFGQLKGRIIAEFDRMQQNEKRRPGEEPMRLEIEDLDGYWLSGVEVIGARLVIPPKPTRPGPPRGMGIGGVAEAKPAEEAKATELAIDRATARLRLLPLILGNVLVDFTAEAFGGEIEGTLPVGADSGDVRMTFENLELAKISPIEGLLEGVPISGLASGEIHLSPKEGKFGKADGRLSINVEGVKLGRKMKNEETGQLEDVVEIQGIRIPAVQIGTLTISGTAVDGTLTIDQFVGRGRDFELVGEGKIKLAEKWENAQADISVKFRFTDTYRTSSAAATSLLGKPGDAIPPLVEMGPSPLRTAKTDDGYYRFTLSGKLGTVEPKPAGTNAPAARRPGRKAGAGTRPPIKASPPGLRLPTQPQAENRDEDDGPEEPALRETPRARREAMREEVQPDVSPPRRELPRPQEPPPPDEAGHEEGPEEAPEDPGAPEGHGEGEGE